MMIPKIDILLNIIDVTIRSSHAQIYLELEDKSQLCIPYYIQQTLNHYINKNISVGIRSDFITLSNTINNFNTITGNLLHLKNDDKNMYITTLNGHTLTLHKNNTLTKNDIGKNFKFYIDTYLIKFFEHDTNINLIR